MFQISRQISHLVLQRLQHLNALLLRLPELRQLGRRRRVLLRRGGGGRRVGPRQLIPQLRDLLVEARQVRPVVQDLEESIRGKLQIQVQVQIQIHIQVQVKFHLSSF